MYSFSLVLLFLLIIALFAGLFRRGRAASWSKILRVAVIVSGLGFFAWWFVESSVTKFYKDALALQVINKLPQTLDFYIVEVGTPDTPKKFETMHIGKIRPEYYRLEYLRQTTAQEIWVAGYVGKRQVYFSQHKILGKNYDQIIEVRDYINQSVRLSGIADAEISKFLSSQSSVSIWVTLDFLLILLNILILLRKRSV